MKLRRHSFQYRELTPAEMKRQESLAIVAVCAAVIAFILLLILFGVSL